MNSKIQVILDLKNRLGAGMQKAKQRLKGDISETKKRLLSFKENHIKSFTAMSEQVPALGNAVSLLSNPYALATAGVIALGAAGYKLGSHMVDVSQKVKAVQMDVKATTGLMGNQLKNTTADVQSLEKVFDVSAREIIQTGNAMHKEFGISMKDSTQLIENALVATNGAVDLDQLREYSTQMKSAGLNAKETTQLIVQSWKDGIYQDKATDSIKEANLRLREMPKATKDALKGIGINATELQNSLNKGTMSTMDAVRQVSVQMQKVDQTARQTAISSIFGTPGEDAGERFLLNLGKAKKGMNGLIDMQDKTVQRQKQRLGLEKKISMEIQGFSDDVNGLKSGFDLLVLKGQLLFYKTLNQGVRVFRENIYPVLNRVYHNLKDQLMPLVFAFNMGWENTKQTLRLVRSTITGITKSIHWLNNKIKEGVNWVYEKTGTKSLVQRLWGDSDSMGGKVRTFFADLQIRMKGFAQVGSTALNMVNHSLSGNFTQAKHEYSALKQQMKNVLADDYVTKQKALLGLKPVVKKPKDETEKADPYTTDSLVTTTKSTKDSADHMVKQAQVARNISINIDAIWKGDHVTHEQQTSSGNNSFIEELEERLMLALNDFTRAY